MTHDVFICHATEDKDELVRPLADALRLNHLDVWYDEFSMKVGDSLREAIDRGLASSRYGIVVIGSGFFAKPWTKRELNGLIAREMSERRKLVLPIWHKIELGDVMRHSPPLADVRALRSDLGLDKLCRELLRAIRPEESPLVVAREELARFGWDPSPISDEWWLDMVEAQDQIISNDFGEPWRFPLPNSGYVQGRRRGENIAWTALQLDWSNEAEHRKICQTTPPEAVLEFVRSNRALTEACVKHPDYLANYAPQLLIPEFSAEFGSAFDALLTASEKTHPTERAAMVVRGERVTLCAKQLALRHPTFGNHEPHDIVDGWMRGMKGRHGADVHADIDYLFWLLAPESSWMPTRVLDVLILGMRDSIGWTHECASRLDSEGELLREIREFVDHLSNGIGGDVRNSSNWRARAAVSSAWRAVPIS